MTKPRYFLLVSACRPGFYVFIDRATWERRVISRDVFWGAAR